MNDNKQQTLEKTLIGLLTKLNHGDKISFDNIDRYYKEAKVYLEKLDDIDEFPFDRSFDDIYCFERDVRETFDKYHIEDIVEVIQEHKTNKNYINDIQNIIKESKLPRRDDKKYKTISSYKPYELTHCISYEMAIRNKAVEDLLKKIKGLTTISKELYIDYSMFKQDAIMREESLGILDKLQVSVEIDFDNFDAIQAYSEIIKVIVEFTVLLEEEYYMIYDRMEIIPEGMEDIFNEPNHHEPDNELNQFIHKVIEENLQSSNDDPSYKDNYSKEDGYVIYQGAYDESKSYDMNKIFPNFKRPMREFNQTQVAFNISLPEDEIVAYIRRIKEDYDNKNTSYKTLNQLLYEDDSRVDDTLDHKQKERYADDFFIYDYYIQSEEEDDELKLVSIQNKLSQYHGMKIEISQNNYKPISYDEAQNNDIKKSNNQKESFIDFSELEEDPQNIMDKFAIETIQEKFDKINDAIESKKYRTLIYDVT